MKLLPRLLAVAACAAAGAAFATKTNAEVAAERAVIAAAQTSVNACRPEPVTAALAAALDLAPGQRLQAGRCGSRRWALITPRGQTLTASGQVLAAEPSGPYIRVAPGSDPCTALPVGLVFEWQLACP
jgi:Flp pilus assembly protein CpaB